MVGVGCDLQIGNVGMLEVSNDQTTDRPRSRIVAIAALTIVFSGTGQAQGGGSGPNVFVTNTPLPVTGNLTATIPGNVNVTGNVNAAVTGDVNATVTGPVTVNNPANNPVLIRDVDAPGAKERGQEQSAHYRRWEFGGNFRLPFCRSRGSGAGHRAHASRLYQF
jgi:hypothetical protein